MKTTNLHDKDGNEIFERDVLLKNEHQRIIVEFENEKWNVKKEDEKHYRKIGHLFGK